MLAERRIQRLSTRLANQIAAGEVVERPASVIKELVENSLDAGATQIDISIERGGVQRMVVSDNGGGIHPDDLPLALARHATSKLSRSEDLAAITSLGFRGEALASIASVARLTLSSRRADQASAWQARAEGADMAVQLQPAALAIGTRVEVADLFFNTPARRRFLRSEATEFAHIDDVIRRQALAHPQVAFTLRHNGKVLRQWRVAGDARVALAERAQLLFGRSAWLGAQAVETCVDGVRVYGWVADPAHARLQADTQFVFVNGRAVRDRVLAHALREGYADALQTGQAPVYAIFIELAPELVDVNVHPTKHEVRFRHARWMHDLLTGAVREALRLRSAMSPANEASRQSSMQVTGAAEVVGVAAVDERAASGAPAGGAGRSSPAPVLSVAEAWAFYGAAPALPGNEVRPASGHGPGRSQAGTGLPSGTDVSLDTTCAERAPTDPAPASWPASGPASARAPATSAHSDLQPVAADRVLCLHNGMPVLLRQRACLARWLTRGWWQAEGRGAKPLLFPLSVTLPADLPVAALARLGFVVEAGLLKQAPALLRDADFARLLPALYDEMPFDAALNYLLADRPLFWLARALAMQPDLLADAALARPLDAAFWSGVWP